MPEEVPEAGRLTVLLSYSRDDLNFADQLEAALQSHKYDVAIDRQGISGGENWKARLGGLIRDADTVIFVLSPSSAASELCKWEVEEASRLGKRIIPVPCRPLGDATVPPQLSALEYIFFIQRRGCPAPVSERGLRALCRRWTPTSIGYASTLDYCSARANGIPRVAPSLGFSSGTASPRPKRGPCVGQRTPRADCITLRICSASEEAEARRQDAERQQLEQIEAAQADRAEALAQREEAQEREAEQARRVVRRTLIGMAVAIVLFLATAALAVGLVGASVEADERSRVAAQQTARAQAFVAELETERGRRFEAATAALQGLALPFNYNADFSQTSLWTELVETWSADEFLVPPLQHAADTVWAAAFDPTGERVATADTKSNTARIWDAQTGEPIGKPLQHEGIVGAAAFDPKGERVVTASADNTARIWRAPPTGQALVEQIRTALGPRAPEPVKLPENSSRQESYGALMALGAQTLFARVH